MTGSLEAVCDMRYSRYSTKLNKKAAVDVFCSRLSSVQFSQIFENTLFRDDIRSPRGGEGGGQDM